VLVHRQRPPQADWLTSADGYAFPSCHAATAVLVWGLVVALAWPLLAGGGHRVTAVIAAGVIAAIAGATQDYLGVHWPSEVVGGWALGGLLLTLAVTALSQLRFRFVATRQHHRPSREGATVGNAD
jgi:membrane-associated phospholipid phosphatase